MSPLSRIMRLAICLLVLIPMMMCEGSSELVAPGLFQRPQTRTLAGFGDSIVYGTNLERSWLPLMLEALEPSAAITYVPEWPWVWDLPAHRHDRYYEAGDTRVYNMGIGGNSTGQMVARFATDVLSVHPDFCLVLGGLNDLFAGVPTATIQSNLASLYTFCEQVGITPVPCTISPVRAGTLIVSKERVDELNRQISLLNAWIANQGFAYIDFNSALDGGSPLLQEDGVHPTQEGYNGMAARAAALMRQEFAAKNGAKNGDRTNSVRLGNCK